MKKQSHTRLTASQWQAILADFHQCGLTQKEYCKQNSLADSTFSKWKAQLAVSDIQTEDFIEICPEATTVSTSNVVSITPKLELAMTWLNKLELKLKVC